MSRHWRPDDHVVPFRRKRDGGALVGVVVAVMLGLAGGAAWLRWSTPQVDGGPSGPIEWNEVQAVPTRAPDAADVAWEKRAGAADAASGGITVSGQHIFVIDGDTFD